MPLDRYRNAALVDGIDVRALPLAQDPGVDAAPAAGLKQPRHPVQQKYYFSRGVVTDAVGSGYVESGDTKVLCSVHGPMEPKRSVLTDAGAEQSRAQLQVYYKLAPFACRQAGRVSYLPDEAERRAASFLQDTLAPSLRLDRLPKSRIEVHCLVLEDAGNCLATAVTCACLALADAGLEMYDLVTAATVCRPVSATDWQLDVGDASNSSSCGGGGSSVTLAYMRNLRQVAGMLVEAAEPLQPAEVEAACRMCEEPCKLTHSTLRHSLLKCLPPAGAANDENMA